MSVFSHTTNPPLDQAAPKDKLGRFAVVNTQIICFVPGKDAATTLNDQDKTDVINSTLLAQLSASQDAKSFTSVEGWFQSFLNIAGVTGWTIETASTFKSAAAADLQVSIDVVAAKFISQSGDVNDLRILEALLYLRGSKSSVGLSILEENGKSKTAGTFQFVIAEKTKDQELVTRIFPYAFETIECITSTIFQTIAKPDTYQMKYMAAPTVTVLNKGIYDGVRDDVAQKLEDYEDLVAFLPI